MTTLITQLNIFCQMSTRNKMYVQGVPKKTPVSVQMLLEAPKIELQIKVG